MLEGLMTEHEICVIADSSALLPYGWMIPTVRLDDSYRTAGWVFLDMQLPTSSHNLILNV